jgi:hypothetical protein
LQSISCRTEREALKRPHGLRVELAETKSIEPGAKCGIELLQISARV